MDIIEDAIALHMQGDLDAAAAIYLDVLTITPEDPTALHYIGILAHQRGDSETGLKFINRSIELAPENADWINDLGNVLAALERFDEAAAAFQAALSWQPDDANLWNNLGASLSRTERLSEAENAFTQAIQIAPHFIPALNNLGDLLTRLNRFEDGAQFYCRAYIEGPHEEKSKHMLGIAYYSLNRVSEAAAAYQDWLNDDPTNPIAAHLLAACSGRNVPPHASERFIELTFDEYAETFDDKLIHSLKYCGPALIAGALASITQPRAALDVLDAGCGTGLCGSILAPFARRLSGIDLSSRMLDQAAARDIYDGLEKAEITTYMRDHSEEFDLIVCADVLIYFGALEQVVAAAKDALRARGLLIFTFETTDGMDSLSEYILKPNGRYSHSLDYVKRVLVSHGLSLTNVSPAVIREEFKKPVNGYVVTALNPSKWRYPYSPH